MSSITFSADLNTDKLESAIKQSNKTISEWSKDVEKAGGKADKSFDNLGRSLKDSISDQKAYIKGLTKEIQDMERAFDKATAGIGKRDAGNELVQAKRRLGQAQGELIGMQNEQIAANAKEEESVKGLSGHIKDWALKLGGVAMAYKMVKEAVMATTVGINAFNIGATVMKQMMYNLITGAASLSNNLYDVVEAQKELNELRFQEKIYEKGAKKEQIEYDKAVTAAHDQTLATQERIDAYDSAFEHLDNVSKLKTKSVQDEIDGLKEMLKYRMGDEKLQLRIADLEIKKLDIEHRLWSGQKEISSMRSGLIKKQLDDEQKARDDANKKAIEDAKIENKIKKEQALLDQAVIDGDEEQQKAIAARIVALQSELYVRKKIAETAIGAAIIRGEPIADVSIPGIPSVSSYKAPSTTELAKPTGTKSKYRPGTNMLTDEALAEVEAKKKQFAEDEEKRLQRQLELRNEIVYAAASLVYQMGEQLGLSEKEQQSLGSILDTFTALASGNYVQAAFSLLSNMMTLIPDATAKFSSEIGQINELLVEQERLIELSVNKGGGKEAREETLRLLKLEKETAEAGLKKAEKSQFWFGIGKKKAKEFKEIIKDLDEQILEAEQDMQDFLSGGVDGSAIADAIAQGFKEGKTSVDDFADYMNDVLLDAVMNVFKSQYLLPLIDKYYMPALGTFMADNILDSDEIADLQERAGYIGDMVQPYFDALTGGLDLGIEDTASVSNAGLTGIVRNITEETGTELAGLFRRFADEQRVVKDYSVLGVTHLINIEMHTFNTVAELQKTNIKLDTVIANTNQVPTGALQ